MDKYEVEDIRRQALESTSRYASGKPVGPLDGVLVAIKDENDVEKFSTDCGSNVNRIPKSDATVVSKLRKAGAIIVGKTKMNEFGLDVTGCNPNAGTARNAYNRNHWPGGSSSGSGAIVGANLCPIAIGNDGGNMDSLI
jgi:Asp-tRNA(Asn)/Glu-tRNA(Gln) amidotransferase A subunit family amidase